MNVSHNITRLVSGRLDFNTPNFDCIAKAVS